MSPLVWDLAHIAAYEDLWLAHRHAGLELLRPDLAELYDAFETPRAVRGEVELLDAPAARAYLREVRERVEDATAARRESATASCTSWSCATSCSTARRCARRWRSPEPSCRRGGAEAARRRRGAARLSGGDRRWGGVDRRRGGRERRGWIELPAGTFAMGAGPEGFAYDNERPRHVVQTAAFVSPAAP